MTHEAPSSSPEALHHGDNTLTEWHDSIPFKQTKIASAIHSVLEPKSYVVKHGDTIADVARIFGISVPPSLFDVKEWHEWNIIENFMVNTNTSASFPVQVAANTHKFARVAANDDEFALAA